MRKALRLVIAVALLALALAAVIYLLDRRHVPVPHPGKLAVHFLDVGQGDGQLIQLPDGRAILIDAGDRGSRIAELLSELGVGRISLVIATHPHSDHIGEMKNLLRHFEVEEFWDSGFAHPTRTYTEMLQEIKTRGIDLKTPGRGDTRVFDKCVIEVLNPDRAHTQDEANDASIVIRLSYGNTRFLFTGDAEVPSSMKDSSAWRNMLAADRASLKADVLKAAHHGSKDGTTEAVLAAVNPEIVIISCKAGNEYGHPHSSVVGLLQRRADSITLCRTDLQGSVTVVSDGAKLDVSTERQTPLSQLYLTGEEIAGERQARYEGVTSQKRGRSRK